MKTYKLEKDIKLYKSQFDTYVQSLFGDYRLDKLSMEIDSIMFRIKYMVKHNIDLDKINILKESFTEKGIKIRKYFGEFLYTFLCEVVTIPEPYHLEDIKDILAKDVKMDNSYVMFTMVLISDNKHYLEYVDNAFDSNEVYNMFPDKYFRFFTDSYNDGIAKAFPELFENRHQTERGVGDDQDVFCHNFTFQTTEACSLSCRYCLSGDTDILLSDFTFKRLDEIKEGDCIIGVDEFPLSHKEHVVQPTTVTHVFSRKTKGYYKLTHPSLNKPVYMTPEHPVRSYRYGWVPIKDIIKSDGLLIIGPDPYDYFDADINNTDYIRGYFTAAFMGDGCCITNAPQDGYLRYFSRFAVKDINFYERMKKYAEILDIKFNISPFIISAKHNLIVDMLCSRTKRTYDQIQELYKDFQNNESLRHNPNYLMGFLAGYYDAEGHIDGTTIRISNSNHDMHQLASYALDFLNIKYTYDKPRLSPNTIITNLRLLGGSLSALKFLKSCKPAIKRKGVLNLSWKSACTYIRGYNIEYIDKEIEVYNLETECHTYFAGRLAVHNCYQCSKTPSVMDFETAKKFIDHLLNDDYGYINRYNSPAIIIEFIGGEPLLEIELTRKIYEYFLDKCYELNHPWFTFHRLSICSNGLQYFNPSVQDFFKEYISQISFNISIDGNKELHDACRIQPNGEGSYDISMAALNHFNKHFSPERNSKMTLAPSNISYLYDSVVDFIEHGMSVININCVFEEGWNQKTALEEYKQLKKLANYLLDNDLEHLYIAIFNERQEDMMEKSFDSSPCGGGSASMLSMRPNGDFYPCIRYMPSSVGNELPNMSIGNVDTGMIGRSENSEIIRQLDHNTRRAQSNDICYECPLSNDCAACAALGYQVFGVLNKKTTFICIQMIAEALANVYYWNLVNIKHPEYDLGVRKNVLPDEWSLLVINEEELNYLKSIESYSMIITLENRGK